MGRGDGVVLHAPPLWKYFGLHLYLLENVIHMVQHFVLKIQIIKNMERII